MNVSLPFASPARKQDTTNNNKKGQPHDTSVIQLKGKHCRKPHCCNGVVDTFRLYGIQAAFNVCNQLL